ncbi:MAG: hypothetical protein ACRD7E_09085 [Bryobacteraceae bacterium]
MASDVLGVSGRHMLQAMVRGATDASKLAELARGRLKSKKDQLGLVLESRLSEHHRFQIELLLEDLEQCEAKIAKLETRIARSM